MCDAASLEIEQGAWERQPCREPLARENRRPTARVIAWSWWYFCVAFRLRRVGRNFDVRLLKRFPRMITLMPESWLNLLPVRASGRLSHDDYGKRLLLHIEAQLAITQPIRIDDALLHFDP